MSRLLPLAALLAALAPSLAAAQEEAHFDVFVGAAGGQTAYGGIDVDLGEVTLNERVFEAETGENPLDNTFFAIEPGFNHPEADSALPAGVTSLAMGDEIFVRKLNFAVDGTIADVFFWDGTGEPSFVPAAGVAFDIVTEGANQSIGAAGAGGGFDDHPEFVLSAGGSLPTPGIYLGSFEAQVGVLDPTDQLFLVMGTEGLITPEFLGVDQATFDMLTDEDLDEALEEVIEGGVDFVVSNVIPEPGSMVLLAFAGAALVASRRS